MCVATHPNKGSKYLPFAEEKYKIKFIKEIDNPLCLEGVKILCFSATDEKEMVLVNSLSKEIQENPSFSCITLPERGHLNSIAKKKKRKRVMAPSVDAFKMSVDQEW